MPSSLTYPGVYIEEIPSGVRTITGVATSIAAFVGWAPKGPTDSAELLLSWSDFERKFGGLDKRSLLGYAVSAFFSNGGQRAYVVRLVTTGSTTANENAVAAAVTLDTKLTVTANSPGEWGNNYAIVTKKRADDATRFQLKVVNIKLDKKGIPIETFDNLSMKLDDPRSVESVLKATSLLVTAKVLGTPPALIRRPTQSSPLGGQRRGDSHGRLTRGAAWMARSWIRRTGLPRSSPQANSATRAARKACSCSIASICSTCSASPAQRRQRRLATSRNSAATAGRS